MPFIGAEGLACSRVLARCSRVLVPELFVPVKGPDPSRCAKRGDSFASQDRGLRHRVLSTRGVGRVVCEARGIREQVKPVVIHNERMILSGRAALHGSMRGALTGMGHAAARGRCLGIGGLDGYQSLSVGHARRAGHRGGGGRGAFERRHAKPRSASRARPPTGPLARPWMCASSAAPPAPATQLSTFRRVRGRARCAPSARSRFLNLPRTWRT